MRSCGQGKSGEYPNVKCPRCLIEEEKWEHIWICWICSKNSQDASEYLIFKESV
ncbi:hypothetical protein GLOIN_2v1507768, partial [Rhizophagus irregularis DAOM 181602=DAOM 197198]